VYIREAREEDAEQLSLLLREIDDEVFLSPEEIKEKLKVMQNYSFYKVFVAVEEGRDDTIVGTFTLYILDNLGHRGTPLAVVESVITHQDHRRKGVGRSMILKAMEIAAERGCYKLVLSSDIKREGAHTFYDRLGFVRHGVSFRVNLNR
jgi:GNAT superfamily N-acetyltransferase